MKFETPAGANPIDRMEVVGKAHDRIDGPLKTTGRAPYAYEHREIPANPAYGVILGAGIARGRLKSLDTSAAERAPGVLVVVTAANAGPLGQSGMNTAPLLGGPEIVHYHQAIALVVARTFEEATAAAALLRPDYAPEAGRFDLAVASRDPALPPGQGAEQAGSSFGDFDAAFAAAPVKVDQTYATPPEAHAMMEPHASIAWWEGERLTAWTSNQMIAWGRKSVAETLKIAPENVRIMSPYIGGGFGGKLFLRTDMVMAALGARAAKCPVKVVLQRPLMFNNTTHRPATIQRLRLGAEHDGTITAIAHENVYANMVDGSDDSSTNQTQFLYAGANRLTKTRQAVVDWPEGNAMRAPGEATGLMALEVAMDELAEGLGMCPVKLRIHNDTQVAPENPSKAFSQRHLVACLQQGAERFGWDRRSKAGTRREGDLLIGMGVAAAYRGNINMTSAARVKLDGKGHATVETDMTDIGTGSYTILAQTAAEMLGLPMSAVTVTLGDSSFPVSAGSGGQWGANSSTSGLYAACVKLRGQVCAKLGLDPAEATFAKGQVTAGNRSFALSDAGAMVAEDTMQWGQIAKDYVQATFGAHFVEVSVDAWTGEIRVRRMLAVCDAGRILNPKTARSQMIGAMTMGVGGALMEELAVDTRFGHFVNHDLAGYEVPVHLDIPHQEVIFLDTPDDKVSPMKAKGVGELGLCGVAAALANAVYNATGVRVREYPVTLDKLLDKLPQPV
ncbi:aldehyde oxidoreductase molybdenum-binding subunit PaoC [Novosphingobium sp. 9]|uniref:aldehyde oxidoreductase molybdenum-binding subunit PaoC n=1 Tax=Novosphingobium sp. 9 TaxID=2025349 RepID=UPI0021B65B8A|nr:aldehyde oxidoreductase molybdenum-binding subunit PaoC [Novosphingobium sp. 9]